MNELGHTLVHTVFLGKFMFLFALLFGAGVVLYGRKYDTADDDGAYHTPLRTGWKLWYRRCAVLLVFGIIHAYGFWYGDILTWYSVTGLCALWWVRRWKIKTQIIAGAGFFLLGTTLLGLLTLFGLYAVQNGHISQVELLGSEPSAEIAAYLGTNEIGQRYGSYVSALIARLPSTLMMHLLLMPLFVPAITGIMMFGMATFRSGLLTGQRSTRFYLTWGAILTIAGGALTFAVHEAIGGATKFEGAFLWQTLAQPLGIPLAFGYLMLVIAMTKSSALRFITHPLACVGRMALTNYALQTLLCTTFFYGYGFARFATIDYPGLWVVMLCVWTINIALSMVWLRLFDFGPLEWLWRSLTYGRIIPIRTRA